MVKKVGPLYVALGQAGNCFSPAIHIDRVMDRTFGLTVRTSDWYETRLFFRFGQQFGERGPVWGVDMDSEHLICLGRWLSKWVKFVRYSRTEEHASGHYFATVSVGPLSHTTMM